MNITLQEARKLDVSTFSRVKRFCFTVVRSNFKHDDNQREIERLSQELGIGFQVLCSYIWLQIYLLELSDSFGDIPSPKEIAQMFDISLNQFQQYVDQRTKELDEIIQTDRYELGGDHAFSSSDEPTDEELLDDVAYILDQGD